MSVFAHAALFTVFLWWFTTGAIIFLDGLPRRFFPAIMAAATVVLVLSLEGIASTSTDTSVAGAYWAFTFALLAWGWNEMGFLMGVITGPRDTPCPEGATGWRRLVYATQTVIHHEIAIAFTAFAIMVATAGGENQAALWTFVLLWVMRLSAKINVYLGVPNITEEFLPPHLKYLKTYFRTRPMNAMFPVSVTGATVLTAYLGMRTVAPGVTPFEATMFALLTTLSALALIEHWFMVLPIPATALWQWGLVSHAAHTTPAPGASVPTLPVRPPSILDEQTFEAATATSGAHQAPSHFQLSPETRPPVTVAATEATIVPFPLLTPVSNRRRP
jgi:putative photosynthetic complex assembly protein 2